MGLSFLFRICQLSAKSREDRDFPSSPELVKVFRQDDSLLAFTNIFVVVVVSFSPN